MLATIRSKLSSFHLIDPQQFDILTYKELRELNPGIFNLNENLQSKELILD